MPGGTIGHPLYIKCAYDGTFNIQSMQQFINEVVGPNYGKVVFTQTQSTDYHFAIKFT